jgi:hypothetical protein
MGKAKLCGLDQKTLNINNPDESQAVPNRIELVAGAAVIDVIKRKHSAESSNW